MNNVKVYVEQYMAKVFYFSLKRTGNVNDAEDLTSDISLNVLIQLNKEVEIENLSAYIWKIAHNRYSIWANNKRKRAESIEKSDISDFKIPTDTSIENEYVRSEEISLLRRELAFISKEYRDIVIAYYIDNCRVRTIADKLQLSEGTVKMRLSRVRNILKEGMNMAREFGTRSYKPEDIDFLSTGPQPSGLPWSVVHRKIPKNILLQADNNPSTAEELAVELGISAPYMEEEIDILHRATLLKKDGAKYITNFFIANKSVRKMVYEIQRKDSKRRSKLINDLIDDIIDEVKKMNVCRGKITNNDLKWWLALYIVDCCDRELAKKYDAYPKKRENGEEWGFIGSEKIELPEGNLMIGYNGNGDEKTMFFTYKINDYNMRDRAGDMNYHEIMFLADVIRKNRNVATITENEEILWNDIKDRFAHSDAYGNIIPDMIVLEEGVKSRIYSLVKSNAVYSEIVENTSAVYLDIIGIIKDNINKFLRDNINFYASMQMNSLRMMTVHDLVECGTLIVPEIPQKSTLAMHIEL